MQQAIHRRDIIAFGIVALTGACSGSTGSAVSVVPGPTPSPSPTPSPAPTPTPSPTFGLTVTAGSQAISQIAGATRDVFADADPADQVFDRWTGDVGVLLNAAERASGVRTLAAPASVAAVYRSLPAFAFQIGTLAGSAGPLQYYYYFPQPLPPRGVVFRFHGTGGSARSGTTRVEEMKFNRDLVANGYGVVTLDSDDRVNAQWNNSVINTGNIDVVHVQQVIAALTGQGLMNASTRLFAMGHSNGGGFAPVVGSLLGWRAAWISFASGSRTLITQQSTLPAIWTIGQNDTTIGPSGNANAMTNFQSLTARGVPADFITFVPSAVYPSRFAQIAGLSAADSQVIYNAIRGANLLDANDYQFSAPANNQAALAAAIPAAYSASSAEIGNQLRIAYAEHEFTAAASARVRRFFEAR